MSANDNTEIMGILPPHVSRALFNIGWRYAYDLSLLTKAARPKPTADEAMAWIVDARRQMNVRAAQCLQNFSGGLLDADFRWLAERLATEGFEAYIKGGANA